MGLGFNPTRDPLRGCLASQALAGPARITLPAGVRYVLMLRRTEGGEIRKPMAFAGVDGMARHIHAARGRLGLQLLDSRILMADEHEPRDGVSIWLLDPSTQDRRDFLGWAYVNGASAVTLDAALRLQRPGPEL